MGDDRNPAGRLHDLLSAFGAQPDQSTAAAWSAVLQVSESELPMYLGDVARLLREVQDAATDTGLDAFDPIQNHLTILSESILPRSQALNDSVRHVRPDANSMQALKMLSVYLEQTAPDGRIPPQAETDELRAQVRELLEAVGGADLDPNLKRVLLRRLSDLLTAFDHLDVGGPDAVRRAAESLAISAVLYERDADEQQAPLLTRLKKIAYRSWVAFNIVTTLANAPLMWERIIDAYDLPAGQEQRQLPAGAPSEPVDPPDPDQRAA